MLVTLALAGCDTMQSDFSSFVETFNPPTPAQAAAWAVDTNDAENQRRGIALLAGAPWGGAEPYQKLYRLYIEENTDPLVKAFAIRALGRHGDAADAVLVAKQLDSTYRIVRLEAAKALQRLHDPKVADAIWKQLLRQNPEEDADIRTELAIALGQYPTDAVFNALVNALDQRELAVNWAALDSLQSLTGHDFGLDQAKWLAWKDSTKTPFRTEECFLYPTYRRDKNWLDYMLFWVPLTFEEPGLPQGMKITGPRRTYQGEQPTSDFKLPEKEAPEPPEKPAPPTGPKPASDGSKG
jgi:HEAT repeat protein